MSIDDPQLEVSSESASPSEKQNSPELDKSPELNKSHELAQLREEKGLTIETVANALRISEDFIRAMEAHDLKHLPEPAFIRGYLRNYARLLDCDPEVLIAEFDRSIGEDGKQAIYLKEGHDEPMTLRAHRTPSAAMGLGLVMLALIGGLSYFAWTSYDSTGDEMADALEPAAATEENHMGSSLMPEPLMGEPQGFEPPPEFTKPDENVVEEVESEPVEVVSEPRPEASNLLPVSTETPDINDGKVKMVVRFKEDCWIQIKDASERVLMADIQRAGTVLELNVLPPVSVRMGNAPGIESIMLAGSPVSINASKKVASLVLEPARG